MKDRPTCKTCPYADTGVAAWLAAATTEAERTRRANVRFCHRRAPGYLEDGVEPHADHWCGEHPDFPLWLAARNAALPPSLTVEEAIAMAQEYIVSPYQHNIIAALRRKGEGK